MRQGKTKVFMCVVLAALTWSCAREEAVPVMLPTGAPGAVVYCKEKAQCYHVATHACHRPYTILQANNTPANDFTSSQDMTEYVIRCASNDQSCTPPAVEESIK